MSAFQPFSASTSTPQSRAQALRLVRAMMGKTLAYFEDREDSQLKLIRAHLLDLSDSKLPLLQSQNLRTAAVLLDRQAEKFKPLYRSALQQCLQEEMLSVWPELEKLVSKPVPIQANDLDGMSLSLIDLDEVHRILLLDRVAERFNTHYERGLISLTQKLGALFDQQNLSLSSNPFRPSALLAAFMRAWEKSELDPQVTEDLVQTLAPAHTIDLTELYSDLGAILSQAGIHAHTQHRIRKSVSTGHMPLSGSAPLTDGGTSSQAPLTTGRTPLDAHAERSSWGKLAPAGQQIAAQVKAFLHRLGVGSAPTPTGPVPPAAPALLDYLENIQAEAGPHASRMQFLSADANPDRHTNVLWQIREQAVIQEAPEIDRGTVDALAEVFDYVFADEAIPMQMKVIIGRLQIPVLRAAMMDRDFFLRSEHPARKLVDTLASSCVTWTPDKGEADPLYQRIEYTVQRVLNEFEDDLALFSTLLAEFTEFLFESEQQAQEHIEPVVQREGSQEALTAALAHADECIHARLNALPNDLPLAAFLTPFLTTQWRQVIANAWIDEERTPGHWNATLKTMEQLIWSTQPKSNAEDRKALVAMLPELVRTLNAELDAIDWSGEPRATFTRRLIGTHMQAIRMKAVDPVDTQGAALEIKAGQAAMEALDHRRSQQLAAQTASDLDDFSASAQLLTRGVWFEVTMPGQAAYRCRLSWVSPMRTRFLFTNREGFDAFVRSEREVAAMLRDGQLHMLEQTPIVERALNRIMADNDDQLRLQA